MVLPMKISTPEEFKPRALTLDMIRLVAYTYRPNTKKACSLN